MYVANPKKKKKTHNLHTKDYIPLRFLFKLQISMTGRALFPIFDLRLLKEQGRSKTDEVSFFC